MKKIRLISALTAALMLMSQTWVGTLAADAAPVEIDGVMTSFVSSFGKMSYGGSSRTAFKSLDEGIASLSETGGKIVFTGEQVLSGDTIGAGSSLLLEGVGSKPTGNVIKTDAAVLNAVSDITLSMLSFKLPEGAAIVMNGHDYTTAGEVDSFYTSNYQTGEKSYTPSVSILSGDASEEYSFSITSGRYATVALASGNVTADSEHTIAGGTFEKLIVGSFDGTASGDITVTISGGEIGELVVGAEDGSMNGNINIDITGGTVGKISAGAYGSTASFDGSALVSVSGASIGSIGASGDGKSDASIVYVSATEDAITVEENAKYSNFFNVVGGTIVPSYDANGKFSGVYCYDDYGCAAAKLVSDAGVAILPQNGLFSVPEGKFSGEIISAINLSVNDSANFVAGYSDGSFLPQNNMTRAEAITLLSRVIVANEDAVKNGNFKNNFTDVADDAWYAKYIGFFDTVGLLTKLENNGKISPDAPITRGEFVQLIYNIEKKLAENSSGLSYKDFAKLVYNVSANIANAEKFDEFSDVDYTNTNSGAIYHAVANGYVNGYADGTFAPTGNITRAEVVTVVNRMLGRKPTGNAGENGFTDISSHWANGQILAAANPYGTAWIRSSEAKTAADGTSLPDYVTKLMGTKSSDLGNMIATHVYKSASETLVSSDITPEEKTALKTAVDAIRNEQRSKSTRNILGTADDPKTHIYSYMGGPYVRDVTIKSFKPDTEPAYIVQTSDTHFNLVNELDEEEKNPSVMSTKIYRKWLANGVSVTPVARAMNYARYSDQTIVTGDILDYLSHGCKQLTIENLFRVDTDIMACLGNHDSTRVMEGKVSDPTSYESRADILREFWIHDIYYSSKVIKDKVMCIVMDNGTSKFWDEQVPKLKADLEKARENDLVVLIFVHIPLASRNPAETEVVPISSNTGDVMDVCNSGIGKVGSTGATAEVYDLITQNGDIVRGVFCGHWHNDYYSEILATYTDESGATVDTVIPQYVLTATVYDNVGHVINIVVE